MQMRGRPRTVEQADRLRSRLRAGEFDARFVEVEVAESPQFPMMQIFGPQGMEELGMQLGEMLGNMPGPFGKKSRRKRAAAK